MNRPCIEPGCPHLSPNTRCAFHQAQRERQRGSPTKRGLDSRYQRVRLRVLRRDCYRCHWCGLAATTADHLIPRAQGGTNDEANLVAACGPCNSSRGATVRR